MKPYDMTAELLEYICTDTDVTLQDGMKVMVYCDEYGNFLEVTDRTGGVVATGYLDGDGDPILDEVLS
jgi:YD repeat-containing protein